LQAVERRKRVRWGCVDEVEESCEMGREWERRKLEERKKEKNSERARRAKRGRREQRKEKKRENGLVHSNLYDS